MRFLRMEIDVLPPGFTHNDVARRRQDRVKLGLDPQWLPRMTVTYGMELGPWRIDWYDLWAHRFGRPEFNRIT